MKRILKDSGYRDSAGRTIQRKSRRDSVSGDISSHIGGSPLMVAQRRKLQSLFGSAAQLQEEPASRPNNTGLPDNLKTGIENLSGMSMDHVKVHYNSSIPAQLNALAYAQGSDIHVAPGQEKHLPHEAWHVVQQAQGRVKPTQRKGISGEIPVQCRLTRNPEGRRSLWDVVVPIQVEDVFHAGDWMNDDEGRGWFRFRRRKSPDKILVESERGGRIFLYDINAGTFQNVDHEVHQGMVDKMIEVNQGGGPGSGVHYPFNYQANHPDLWQEQYETGYASEEYFHKIGPMDWTLRENQSASAAIRQWLQGLTIAECASTIVAIQLDAIRNAIGDGEFDRLFGSADPQVVAAIAPLRINGNVNQCIPEQWLTGAGTERDGGPTLKPGAKYFFGNHSSYSLKHPDGYFQGENCVYEGGGLWSGFGVAGKTTDEMYQIMIEQYNDPRTIGDYYRILTSPGFSRIPMDVIRTEREQQIQYSEIYSRHLDDINYFLRTIAEGGNLPDLIGLNDIENDDQAGITSQGIALDVRAIINHGL